MGQGVFDKKAGSILSPRLFSEMIFGKEENLIFLPCRT